VGFAKSSTHATAEAQLASFNFLNPLIWVVRSSFHAARGAGASDSEAAAARRPSSESLIAAIIKGNFT
jgi:hypothetical protein